mgnify:CR=1 FL=1
MTDLVLVTGVSGFIASHVTAGLLKQGYAVRGTVRNKDKGQRIVDALAANGTNTSRLELVEANLVEGELILLEDEYETLNNIEGIKEN